MKNILEEYGPVILRVLVIVCLIAIVAFLVKDGENSLVGGYFKDTFDSFNEQVVFTLDENNTNMGMDSNGSVSNSNESDNTSFSGLESVKNASIINDYDCLCGGHVFSLLNDDNGWIQYYCITTDHSDCIVLVKNDKVVAAQHGTDNDSIIELYTKEAWEYFGEIESSEEEGWVVVKHF